MGERIFVQGNEAIGWGAISAGCLYFFGYPITPQNEIPEWFSRELPKRGGVFVQTQAETGSINMLMGAATTGVRAMTSTSSPGWGLMQEGMSSIAAAELPCVVVVVQRGGPGGGSIRHSQMDYISVTRGGGGGGYKNIVLAPASVQETHDLMQLAFHLADKYCNPVVVLSDGIIGQVAEPLEVKTIDFGSLPEKDWVVRGRGRQKDGKRRLICHGKGVFAMPYPNYISYLRHMREKYQQMEDSEVRYEAYLTDDADLIVVACGYVARTSKRAVNMARAEGLKVGLFRPITVWPFPTQPIREKALQGCKFLVAEDSLGLLVKDVEVAVEGRAEIHLIDILSRHIPTDGGMLLPRGIFAEIKRLMGGEG